MKPANDCSIDGDEGQVTAESQNVSARRLAAAPAFGRRVDPRKRANARRMVIFAVVLLFIAALIRGLRLW
jgi:hypothetical protein